MKSLILVAVWLGLGICNPLQPEEDVQIQENFDLAKIYGKWYFVAVGSTCKYLKLHQNKFSVAALELSEGENSDEVRIVNTGRRADVCTQIVGSYQKTDIPGKFTYYNQKYKHTSRNYIAFTNYDEYLIMVMKKSHKSKSGTTVKLYGRNPELRSTLIEEFRQFALDQGIPEDSIFTLTNKGECVPGETEEPHRILKREVLPEEEGSGGDNTPLSKNNGDSCRKDVETGPCLGSHIRYFYNASSMACETFRYGGCLGNGNNFNSEKECLQTCRTEAACRLPTVTGPCKVIKTRWTFDSVQGKCVTFQYGGCQGNGNQFYTEKECKEYCGVQAEDLLSI